MKVQLACLLAKELLEQNTFSEGDRKKLDRFDRKDKDGKFVKKINQEVGEFFEELTKTGDVTTFMEQNGIKKDDELYGGHWQRFPFYKEQDGKLVQQPLTFGTGYKDRETAYNEFIKNNLQSFINKYNGVIVETADAAAQLSSDIAHNPELGVTKHAAWALDNADAIKDAGTQRDMKRAEKRANKFETKRQKRLLDLLDDQEDAIVDTIRDHLKTSNPELNKRQRKVFADMLFDRLYSYDDLTKVPDPIELTHTFKNPVPIKVSTSGLATIFASVQVYKADYRAEKGLDADRRASRFQRKLDVAEADKQEAFEEYTDLLDASTTMTIDGKSIDISNNNNYKAVVLLSDINFDGAMLPAKDLADGEFKRNWLGRILVEGVLRSVGMSQDKSGDGQNYRKYAKSFKNQPINNNLETQISTAREIARARKGAEVVDANLKALLQKGFGEAAINMSTPLYDILKENIEYSMFLKRIFIMEPDILVGLFEHGPKALDIKYAALHEQQKRTENGANVANAQKIATELMQDPETKQAALDKIKESDIEAVRKELIDRRRTEADPHRQQELDKLIKGLDEPENRDKLRWQLASGGLMAMVGAQYRERHQVIYTYDNHANVPILADANGQWLPYDQAYNPDGTPKPGMQPTNTYEDANSWKEKLKRTNFSYGLGTGGTLLAESNGSYKQSVTYGISALYSDFATNDPSQQKDGFSFGLSFGYNGTQGLGQVGTSNSYKANINFGVGVGMGADMQGNFVFGPYVYLSPDVLLNGGKLTHTLDAKGAVRLRAGVSGSLNKGLLSFVPNMGLSNDRIEGYTIIEDNLKNKVGPILENILLGLKGRDLSAAATQTEMEKMYADVVMSIDEKLGRSKPKNINKAAKLLSSILSVYAGSDVTKHDDYEAHVKAIAPELATVFANQRWNENIEALRGWKITSVNVGSIFALALFGITPLSIASAVLGTVGTTAYGRAVAENNKPSLAEAQEDFEQNYSAQKVELEPSEPDNLGLGNSISVFTIQDVLVSKDPSLADSLVTSDPAGNLKLHKDVASKIEVRIAKTFTVGKDAAAKTYPIADYLKTDGDFLIIPADMAGGISELVDKNTRKTTLTIGIPIGEPIADAVVWKGTETFAGDPNKFNGTGEVAVADLNAKLQEMLVGATKPLAGMSFDYNATSGVLTLNKAGTPVTQVATYTQADLLKSDKLITISKDATGSYALAIADHSDANFSGLKIDYKETTNVVGADFGTASRLNFNNAAYEGLFDQSFINQFADAKLLRSIMRGKYHKIYNAFNAAMVAGDYTTAKTKAEALLGSLQQDGRINTTMAFAADNNVLLQKQLFRFEALLIYSNACYCDDLHGNSGEVDFSKFVLQQDPSYKQFDGLMKIRKVGFARRVKNTFPVSSADLTTTRNTVASKLSTTANANGQKLEYARRDGAVGLVFGYPEQAGVKDKLESKIVYNPRAITESITKMDIKDPSKNAELMKAFTDKMDVINGADRLKTMLIDKVTTQQAKDEITNNFQAIYDQFLKGEIRTGQYATVDLDFSFFFYPNCANEGILLEANVAEKPYTPTQNVGNTQVERGLPGPTGFWLNAPSVMQRAEVTAVNVGLTAAGTYTKDVPEYVTSSINVPESPTSIPQIHLLIDGQVITIDLAPNNGQIVTLPNGQKFGMQFTGYDGNGTPQWNFNFLDSDYNTVAEFGNLGALKNSSQRSSLGTDLQNALIDADKAYANQVTWINGNSTAVVPKYLTADQIALQAVQWIDHDRDGLQITVTDRIRKK